MITWTLTSPIPGAFTGDTTITGVILKSVYLDFVAQVANVVLQSIGGPSGGVLTWELAITVPPSEAATLLGQLKTAVSAALGVSFQ
jgi:hypothetical protein